MSSPAGRERHPILFRHSPHWTYAPMWVLKVQDVLNMDGKFLRHHELKQKGLLKLREHTDPKAWVVFISHQWLGREHPDPHGERLHVLQDFLRGLICLQVQIEHDPTTQFFMKGRKLTKAECRNLQHAYLWLDYFCVPQAPEATEEEQIKYIFSIPFYVDACELFLAMVPRCYNEAGEPCGLPTWLQRGWCRTEMWCKLLSDASDIPIAVVTRGDSAEFPTMRWTFHTIHTGEFSVEADRASCRQVVQRALQRKIAELKSHGDLDRYRLFSALFESLLGLPPRQRSLKEFLDDFAFKSLKKCRGRVGVGPVACAALAGDAPLIHELVTARATLHSRTRADEYMGVMPECTPLHLACWFRSDNLLPLRTLIELRANTMAGKGGTPGPLNFCHTADAVELLVEHGASVNVPTSTLLWPPLHTMCMNAAEPETLAKILELRADPNGDPDGSQPLAMLGVWGNSNIYLIESAQLLLRKKADVNKVFETVGIWRIIELGCRAYGLFSRKPPMMVKVFGNFTTNCLGWAAMYGCEDLAVFLLQARADTEVRNHRGLRPIDLSKTAFMRRLIAEPPRHYLFLSDRLHVEDLS
ncbi:unnamed protein product [Symbiodinium sp. CCMP2592]|nr:unnamed protein product [Symbiodinium sp. CCMP2592]